MHRVLLLYHTNAMFSSLYTTIHFWENCYHKIVMLCTHIKQCMSLNLALAVFSHKTNITIMYEVLYCHIMLTAITLVLLVNLALASSDVCIFRSSLGDIVYNSTSCNGTNSCPREHPRYLSEKDCCTQDNITDGNRQRLSYNYNILHITIQIVAWNLI